MPHDPKERAALGRCLAAARKEAGFTIESASTALTVAGHKISKGGVGHWEKGTNVPDGIWLCRLAKLYGTTVGALVGQDAADVEPWPLAGLITQAEWRSLPETVRTDALSGALIPIDRHRKSNPASGESSGSPSMGSPRRAA